MLNKNLLTKQPLSLRGVNLIRRILKKISHSNKSLKFATENEIVPVKFPPFFFHP